jgi:hypothetical protein
MIRILTRRSFLRIGGIAVWKSRSLLAQTTSSGIVTEDQKGDPDASYEQVRFDRDVLDDLISGGGKATFEPWKSSFSAKMLGNARKLIGCSRDTSPDQIARFLSLFGLPYKDSTGYLAFCAAGIGFCAATAYADLLGLTPRQSDYVVRIRQLLPDIEHWYYYPTVSCNDIYHIALGKHRWVANKVDGSVIPKRGWIVLFDWNNTGRPDHCGIVSGTTKEKILTVEFNTSGEAGGNQRNGGVVSEKARDYNRYVKGFVVTDLAPGVHLG